MSRRLLHDRTQASYDLLAQRVRCLDTNRVGEGEHRLDEPAAAAQVQPVPAGLYVLLDLLRPAPQAGGCARTRQDLGRGRLLVRRQPAGQELQVDTLGYDE